MKCFFSVFLFFISFSLFAQQGASISPLASYDEEWSDTSYYECNTAADVSYMSSREKEVIYILNLVRSYPEQFVNTVLKKYLTASGQARLLQNKYYYQSLVNTLLAQENKDQLPLLFPDEDCYNSARCHAYSSGIKGYIGHTRQTKDCKAKQYYSGECCDYGNGKAIDIVMALLIDEGVPSLGHRKICLGDYTGMAVSIQPHKKMRVNAVLDFYY